MDLLSALYRSQESAVRTACGTSKSFGIIEESDRVAFCNLSFLVYNYAESVMREALDGFEGGIVVGGRLVKNLRYADDATLICSSKDDLTDLVDRVKNEGGKRGLFRYAKKTKIIVIDQNWNAENDIFYVDGQQPEVVSSFEYLGLVINTNADCLQEIRQRLGMGSESNDGFRQDLKKQH